MLSFIVPAYNEEVMLGGTLRVLAAFSCRLVYRLRADQPAGG